MAIFLKIFIVLTLVFFLVSKSKNRLLFILLLFSALNIIITDIVDNFGLDIQFNNNIYVLTSNLLWFLVIKKYLNKIVISLGFTLFITSASVQLLSADIFDAFFSEYFVCTALIYLISYCLVSYNKLKSEDLSFFKSNEFLLLSSPLLFFIGMCLMFGFKSRIFTNAIIFNNVSAFRLINFIVNIVMYSMLILYIYNSRKIKPCPK